MATEVQKLYTEFPFPAHSADNQVLIDVVSRERGFFDKYLKPGMVALDAGCGTGNYTAAFASLYPEVRFVGADFTEASVAQAQQMFGDRDNLTFVQHDLLEPFATDTPFDVVLSLGVIHHLADQQQGLTNLKNALKDEGVLIAMLYGEYGRFELKLIQNIVQRLSPDADWDTRFDNLDRLKTDSRFTLFLPPKSRFEFIPKIVRRALNAAIGRNKDERLPPNRPHEADRFFHPIENHHTLDSIFALLAACDLEFLELNHYHQGSLAVPDVMFEDPVLNERAQRLPPQEKMIVAECLTRPDSYYFSSKKKPA